MKALAWFRRASRPAVWFGLLIVAAGCQSGGPREEAGIAAAPPGPRGPRPIQRVVALYHANPWLDADRAGDRDPEGLEYRVFLVPATDPRRGRGEWRDGILHIEMYRLERAPGGKVERRLASDWHYPTEQFGRVKSEFLGEGYHVKLVWASKSTAGSEIELLTEFESPAGHRVRSQTKRLRVPTYGP